MIKLNLGSNCFPLEGFINIDLDPQHNPDLLLDITKLDQAYLEGSVDFINAGHIFEHLVYDDALISLRQCHRILKPYCSILMTCPDYSKCGNMPPHEAERIILAKGEHRSIFNSARMAQILGEAGFRCFAEITDLRRVPFIVVPNRLDPQPELWQTSYLAMKI